ncbi:MAG: serine/threonine protein kinase [Polyangiaceae bacterium]|nr:serine/threonine protein kinase [Polyangiaceae bacterium]
MPGLPLDIPQLSTLALDDHRWLAEHWCRVLKDDADAQLGPAVAPAVLEARIHFANVALMRASAADLAFASAHPVSFACWAQSAAHEAGFQVADAVRLVRSQSPRGAVHASLDAALEARVAGGPDRERLAAWAGLPDRRRRQLLAEPRTHALVATAIESLSREGVTSAELAQRLGDSAEVLCALVPPLVGREATLAHARLAAATLDVASVRLASMRGPLGTAARAAVRKLMLHANVSVFAPACRAFGRMATDDKNLRDEIFGWLAAAQATLRRRALAMLVSMDPRQISEAESDSVALRLEEALARAEDEWRFSTVGPLLVTAMPMHPSIEASVVGALEGGKRHAAARWAIARGLASSRRPLAASMVTSVALAAAHVHEELASATNMSRRLLLLRTQADLAALMDPKARKPPHMVEAMLLGDVAGGDGSTTAARATKALGAAAASLEAVTSLSDPAELARVEDALELVCGGTLARIAATAGDSAHTRTLPDCSALVGVALASLDGDFAVTRTALRVVRDAIDVAMWDENAAMRVADVFAAFNAATSRCDDKFIQAQDKNLGEIVQRMALACGGDDTSGRPGDGVRRLAGFLALVGGNLRLLETLQKFDEELDQRALDALETDEQQIAAALEKFAEARPEGVALAPVVRAVIGADVPLIDALVELDDLRAILMAPRILSNVAQTDLRRAAGAPSAPATLDPERLSARLRDVQELLAACLADPLVAFGIDAAPARENARATTPSLGRAAKPIATLTRLIDELATTGNAYFASRYEEVALLGAGNMGEAYLVRDRSTRRLYIQKRVIVGGTPAETAFRSSALRREWEATRELYHPNVVTVHAIEERRSGSYMLFEYVLGCDLEAYVAARPLSDAEARRVIGDVGAGLERIHGGKMVHRDVKPANVMLGLDLQTETLPYAFVQADRGLGIQRVVVIDFGIGSQAGSEQDTFSTLEYASPEQLFGGSPAHASQDVYSLGCLAFHALTGTHLDAHQTENRAVAFARALRATVLDPENSALLENAGHQAWIPWIAAATHPLWNERPAVAWLRANMPG